MTDRALFETKRAAEHKLYVFPYTLPVGVTISSAIVTATVHSGIDASPASLISGVTSISGARVSQMIIGGTAGVTYELMCTAVLSDSEELKVLGYLAVTA